jgi:hypothetical protein
MIVEQPLSEELITGNGRLKRSEVIGRYRADIENQYQRKTDFDTSGLAANVF